MLRLAAFAGILFAAAGVIVIVTFIPLLLQTYKSAASIAADVHSSTNTRLAFDVSSSIKSHVDLLDHLGRYYSEWHTTNDQKKFLFDIYRQYGDRLEQFHAGRESNGNFVSMYRYKPPRRNIWKWAVRNATVPCRKTYALDPDTLDETYVKDNGCSYDPRLRSWYGLVNHSYVATVPLSPMSDDPGVTMYLGRQMLEPVTNRVIGVYHIDLSTDVLEAALKRTSIGKEGQGVAFVVTGSGEVFGISWTGEATTDLSDYNATDLNPIVRVKNVTQLEHPLARVAVGDLGIGRILDPSLSTETVDVKMGNVFVSLTRIPVYGVVGLDLRLIVAIDETLYVSGLVSTRDGAIIAASMVVAALCALQAAIFFGIVARPMKQLSADMEGLQSFQAPASMATSAVSEVSDLQAQFFTVSHAMVAFSRYVPKEVVSDLLAEGGSVELGMSPVEITCLFVDIASFTTLCESFIAAPEVLSELLTDYFSRVTTILLAHGSTVDKFIGDAVMCFWGAPLTIDNRDLRALLAALQVRAEIVETLRDAFAQRKQPLHARVGIANGVALSGNMGSRDRLNYTALGDVVNSSARLEGLNKLYGSVILAPVRVVEDTGVPQLFVTRPVGSVVPVGKTEPLEVVEVLGLYGMDLEASHDANNISGALEMPEMLPLPEEAAGVTIMDASLESAGGKKYKSQSPKGSVRLDASVTTPHRRQLAKMTTSMNGGTSFNANSSGSHVTPNSKSIQSPNHAMSPAAASARREKLRKVRIEGAEDLIASAQRRCTVSVRNIDVAGRCAQAVEHLASRGPPDVAISAYEAAMRALQGTPQGESAFNIDVASALRVGVAKCKGLAESGDLSGATFIAREK